MQLIIHKAKTSKRIPLWIQDSSSTTGAGLTALAFNTSSLVCYSWREDAGNAAGSAVTLATATRGTWASGGFVEKDATNMPGAYEFGIPDAVLASGAAWAFFLFKGATNMAPLAVLVQLSDLDLEDAVHAGLSALPAAAAEASGGLPTLSAAQASNGTINANVHRWLTGTPNALQSGRVDGYLGAVATGVIAAGSFAAGALDAVWSTTTRALTDKANFALSAAGVQAIWDALASALTTTGSIGKLLVTNIDALISSRTKPADTQAAVTLVTTTTNLTDKTGFALSAAGNLAIWDIATSLTTTVGSMGKRIVDFLTGDTYARLGAPVGASTAADIAGARTEIAGVQSDTDNIQTRLPAALVGGRMDASVGAMANDVLTAAALATDAVTELRNAIFARTFGAAYNNLTFEEIQKTLLVLTLTKTVGAATTEVHFRKPDDSGDAVVGTNDGIDRTGFTLTL